MLLSLESWKKVDMRSRGRRSLAKKARGKVEEKEKSAIKENRKIATERVNKRVEKAETKSF